MTEGQFLALIAAILLNGEDTVRTMQDALVEASSLIRAARDYDKTRMKKMMREEE